MMDQGPVLVDFYKQGGCPTCVALYPVLNNVADEYRGRVTVARYAVMTQFFQPTTAYKDTYNIQVVHTAVLFVHDGDGLHVDGMAGSRRRKNRPPLRCDVLCRLPGIRLGLLARA